MTIYVYKAKKENAETVTGHITASTQDEAVELICQLGFLPISVEPKRFDEKKRSLQIKKVRFKELHVFTHQLANLLRSGEALLRSLEIIGEQTQNYYFKSVINRITLNVKGGKSFSESLESFPKIFSYLYISMVRSGEESGNLQDMLLNVSSYQRKQHEIFSKVRTAFAYPIFMGVVGIATIYFILTFVLPRMSSLFDGLGSALPLVTKIMLQISDILKVGVPYIFGIIFIFAIFSRVWNANRKMSILANPIWLKLPFVGKILLKIELLRFCRTMVLLLRSGMPLIKSLDVAIPVLRSQLMRKHLEQCKADLIAGGSFGEAIKRYPEFPGMMGHLVSIGEESGRLEGVLSEIADTYEQETDENIKMMTTLLEPAMILVVGLVIGFIVFAMLLPIFQMDILAG